MDAKELWRIALGELEATVSRANFSTWFRQTTILTHEEGHIVIGVPNIMTKTWLETKFHADVRGVLEKLSAGVRSVEYQVASPAQIRTAATPPRPAETAAVAEPTAAMVGAPAVAPTETFPPAASAAPVAPAPRFPAPSRNGVAYPAKQPAPNNLNPRYTFDSYVVGSSNELAYAACQAVAKSPGTKYNPLYLYGGVGLGKTHLMQAVGNEILRNDPTKRIEYVTIESFTNEFIDAIQKKKNTAFTDKFRNVDVLIIDDMQFLVGKEKTQDEFFHTFNALHQANKQIIISSDKPPQLLVQLEDRLRSRFAMGMIADVQLPDLETRQAILQTKANSHGIMLEPGTIDYLARHAQENIRELEGVLTQFLAFCELRGLQPNVEAATQLLAGQAASKPKAKPLSPKAVIEKVAGYFDLATADIIGPKRDKEIVVPRQITMYLMRHEMSLSFPKIGQAVGGRDHTTAMHSVTKIEKAIGTDENLKAEVETLREQLQQIA